MRKYVEYMKKYVRCKMKYVGNKYENTPFYIGSGNWKNSERTLVLYIGYGTWKNSELPPSVYRVSPSIQFNMKEFVKGMKKYVANMWDI